jgi:peptide/nickel transport system substrate-binding protein
MRRRKFITAVSSGTVIGLAGCQSGQTPSQDDNDKTTTEEGLKKGGTFRISISEKVNSLHPIMHETVASTRWMVKKLYTNLTWVDNDMKVRPELATDWRASDDKTEWTFTLREDAVFPKSGDPITAKDVEASISTAIDDEVGSPAKGALGGITSVKATGEYEVKMTTKQGQPDFPIMMNKSWSSIAPKQVIENQFEKLHTTDFGGGSFNLEEFSPGSEVVASANKDYFGSDSEGNQLPYVDKLRQIVRPEVSSALAELGGESLDAVANVPPAQAKRVSNMSSVDFQNVATSAAMGMSMNVKTPPFDDVRVRKALRLGINRQAFIDGVLNGYGSVGQDTLFGPAYTIYKDLDIGQDLERAKSLLADAGYPDGFDMKEEFGLTFWVANTPKKRLNTALLLADQLKQNLNIKLEIKQLSLDKFLSDVWAQKPMYALWYFMRPSPISFARLVLHSDGGWHGETQWNNDEIDDAIETISVSSDEQTIQENWTKIQKLMWEEGPYLFPMYLDRTAAKRKQVENDLHPLQTHYNAQLTSL